MGPEKGLRDDCNTIMPQWATNWEMGEKKPQKAKAYDTWDRDTLGWARQRRRGRGRGVCYVSAHAAAVGDSAAAENGSQSCRTLRSILAARAGHTRQLSWRRFNEPGPQTASKPELSPSGNVKWFVVQAKRNKHNFFLFTFLRLLLQQFVMFAFIVFTAVAAFLCDFRRPTNF